jgi:ubiquinone/menaquinone biosynthesis C-methylase UbiE
MPSVYLNRESYESYPWDKMGDEWSKAWGGTEYLWAGTIFPRIMKFVPTDVILELAPGFGRCTQFLHLLCKELIIVDLSSKCIEACRERFKTVSNIKYHVNDGKSLGMLEDNSIDFVFSWDSMVHVESDEIYSYLKYMAQKLKPGGIGFIHHSNLGKYKDKKTGKLIVKNYHIRAETMTADLFRQYCNDVGLSCVSQEIIPWHDVILNDCFSVFVKGNDKSFNTEIFENKDFIMEIENIYKIQTLYSKI